MSINWKYVGRVFVERLNELLLLALGMAFSISLLNAWFKLSPEVFWYSAALALLLVYLLWLGLMALIEKLLPVQHR